MIGRRQHWVRILFVGDPLCHLHHLRWEEAGYRFVRRQVRQTLLPLIFLRYGASSISIAILMNYTESA
jgi:hypothetical protein